MGRSVHAPQVIKIFLEIENVVHLSSTHPSKFNDLMSSLWLLVTRPTRQWSAKPQPYVGHPGQAWGRQACAHTWIHIYKKAYSCRWQECEEAKRRFGSKQIPTSACTCVHSVWPGLIAAFHSFPLPGFTSANHFSVRHERPASQPVLARHRRHSSQKELSGLIRGWEKVFQSHNQQRWQ